MVRKLDEAGINAVIFRYVPKPMHFISPTWNPGAGFDR